MPDTALPHDPYIAAVCGALREADLEAAAADTWVEDSGIPYLKGTVDLTPEDSGIDADRYPNGLRLVWDWHTGIDADQGEPALGPAWQWTRLNDQGHGENLEDLPVPGWAAPNALAAAVVTLVQTGTATPMNSVWHDYLRTLIETACEGWAEGATA